MKISLADFRTSASILTLLATSSCGADPASPPPGASGSGGSSLGGAGAGGTAGGGASGGGGFAGGGTAGGGTAGGGGFAGGGASGAASGGTTSGGAGGSSGGGGSFGGGGAAPGTPTFTQVAAIIQANCGSKCHNGEREDIINLAGADPGTLYTRLTSPLDTDLCYRVVPVTRGSAATSLLARLLKAEITEPCALPRMPAGCGESNECLSAADIATIDGWIDAGAFKN